MKGFPCSKILMVRPSGFGPNPETKDSNAFQSALDISAAEIHRKAVLEFDNMCNKLEAQGIETQVLTEPNKNPNPDSIFPNNWFSTHADGQFVLYPMLSYQRRKERRTQFIQAIQEKGGYNQIKDLSEFENIDRFLEGTGSIVFDHDNKLAYCCSSPRSSEEVLNELIHFLNYQKVFFHANDENDIPIYHTNVMMGIGRKIAVVCMDSVIEKNILLESLSNKQIIDISYDQMSNFCGNVLLVENKKGHKYWLMSERAEQAFNSDQKTLLNQDGELLSFPIPTIEKYGGGSVRCMIAELY